MLVEPINITSVGEPPSLAQPVAYWVEGQCIAVLVVSALVIAQSWRLWSIYIFHWTKSLKKVLKKGHKKVMELKKVLKKVMKLKKVLKKVNSLKKALKKVMN